MTTRKPTPDARKTTPTPAARRPTIRSAASTAPSARAGRAAASAERATSAREPAAGTGPAGTPGRRRLFVGTVVAVATVLLVVAVVLVVVRNRSGGPDAGNRPHVVTAPRGERTAADLELISGAATITVRAADLGTDLYRVETPAGGTLVPVVVEAGGRLQLRLDETGQRGTSAVTVQLSDAVRWSIRLGAGASEESVDLRTGQLSALDIDGGASRVELWLPRPDGTVPVRMTAAASDLLIHAAASAPVRLRFERGAGSATIDRADRGPVAAGEVIEPPGWNSTADRYEVDVVGGVAAVTLDRL
jgi:hypothetical protein